MKIEFSPPDISNEEIKEVIDALKSGWITTGPKTKKLEKQVASFCEADGAVCLNSQTACAELTLRLLGIGKGDEVIVPAYTYTATASVVCHVGAKLVIVDSYPNKTEMDYDKLENAITEKTKAIIPVDVAGIPCDYDRIHKIVEKKRAIFKPCNNIQEAIGRIAVCEDAAHAFGASYKGNKIGSVSDFTCFSFHAVKNFTTAEGGAVTWKSINGISDEDIYKQYQLFSLHGQSKDALSKMQVGAWEYDVIGPWYKCNMTDVLASIGIAQMKRYPDMLIKRESLIKLYNNYLDQLGILYLDHYSEDYRSSGHLYITRLLKDDENKRNIIIKKMGEQGIACNVHYKPLPMLTAYKKLGFKIEDYNNAYDFYKNEITLPLHTLLSEKDVEYIISSLRKLL
ncbi:MAG: DegT/DnrJ/EryC1/StrS family aminotransferase [Finegoldia magna]|uniref:DegT/DnrJ/EryC1/StrS family aminotransferase n=1 Tax=Finegoldia magna TaxID=1260 RepID=UPI0026F26738|nr:DegT/DnrJ/EryC1/StrS family aminotransferase [Finegoldia magna]MBS5776371.1 DegT/DnrJ/EryC1/StrS family aminotransferase [Finegoldia magna]MDU2574471.1 DegT/DnrJ/EryC1/StrS family aminotransferase [Finegoldia magna]MDU7479541.1 DegT/DnrJ/EryC1/StrS family aminotransferase [Finegoldia magna]